MSTPDFFRARLDQMIDLRHPLAVLAQWMPWQALEQALAPVFAHKDRIGTVREGVDLLGPSLQVAGAGRSAAGRPRLPMRRMLSLLYLKHAYDLSDEALVERWAENVVWQFFSGEAYYQPRLPCDATQIGRFRAAIGAAGVEELLKATIDCAVQARAVKPVEFARVIVDTTVQEKAVAFSTDSRLLEVARHQVAKAAKAAGIALKQTFAKEGKALILHRGRAKSMTKEQRRWLKRRQAIEPGIGHLKADHRMDRCWLKGTTGDAIHAVLCAAGYNLRWLLRAIVRLGIKPVFLRLLRWWMRGASGAGCRLMAAVG